jgi:hypothetical protein
MTPAWALATTLGWAEQMEVLIGADDAKFAHGSLEFFLLPFVNADAHGNGRIARHDPCSRNLRQKVLDVDVRGLNCAGRNLV